MSFNQFKYGESSESHLATVDRMLAMVARRSLALGIMDMSITDGRRCKAVQDEYFISGKSKVKWPDSKHNVLKPDDLAKAVDIVPYINGKPSWNKLHCCVMAGIVLSVAVSLNVKIRWGGNWDMDGEPITDQDFQDLVHFEVL